MNHFTGILGDPHLDHMIDFSVPSSRDLCTSESVRPTKLNTRSDVELVAGIVESNTLRSATSYFCHLLNRITGGNDPLTGTDSSR